MTLRNQIPDKTLRTQVNQRLARTGAGSQSGVTATVLNGDVTLAGTMQYEHERRVIVRTVTSVQGVGRVVDQIRVEPKKKGWD